MAKKSAKQIAKECGCSHSTILRYLHFFGIKVRSSCDQYSKGQLPYGAALISGQLKGSDEELVIIEQIKVLRTQGLSYHRIAQILNALGVKTKHQKARWHGTTIMNIIKK